MLNVDESVINHYSKLKNINESVECLLKHIGANNNIFVQVDSDCDGFTSSAILINYLQDIFPNVNIKWRLQEGKQHGVYAKNVDEDTNLVIIPDAGSSQYEQHAILKKRGVDVIVLDHHDCEKESSDAIVVNNQLSPEYSNKQFSGAGIVYKFCQALDDRLNINKADYFLDLVAIGNIGDMMDLRELETRYYVKKGLQEINNPFIKEIINKQEYSMKNKVNMLSVTFYVVPLINAAVRAASMSEKRNMMESFLGSKEMVYYKRKDVYETIQVATARKIYNTRNRQNNLKNKEVPKIEEEIVNNNLQDNKILMIDVTGKLNKNLTGLVANQIIRKYKRPVILYRKNEKKGVLRGSARGYEEIGISNFRQFLIETNKFNYCEGHDNAFGFEIPCDQIKDLQLQVNQLLKDVKIEDYDYKVDFVISAKDITPELVLEIAKYKDEWGSKLSEPLLMITDIPVDRTGIFFLGEKETTIKLRYEGIEIMKFWAKKEDRENFSEGKTFFIDTVVKCDVNEWNSEKIAQLSIQDYKVKDVLYF